MLNDYELAEKLTEKNVTILLNAWGDNQDAKSFNTLVRLGDSRTLAMASVLNCKIRTEGVDDFYRNAYCN